MPPISMPVDCSYDASLMVLTVAHSSSNSRSAGRQLEVDDLPVNTSVTATSPPDGCSAAAAQPARRHSAARTVTVACNASGASRRLGRCRERLPPGGRHNCTHNCRPAVLQVEGRKLAVIDIFSLRKRFVARSDKRTRQPGRRIRNGRTEYGSACPASPKEYINGAAKEPNLT